MLGLVMSRTRQRCLQASFKFLERLYLKEKTRNEPKLFAVVTSITLHLNCGVGSYDSYSMIAPFYTFSLYPLVPPTLNSILECTYLFILNHRER